MAARARRAACCRRSRRRCAPSWCGRASSTAAAAASSSDLIKDALNGLIRVVGPGKNRWPCIYDHDLGDLYVKILESPAAAGVIHATDEADERVIDIAEAIAAQVPQRPDIRIVPLTEARKKLGTYADALALDQKVRSPKARALGWAPTQTGVITQRAAPCRRIPKRPTRTLAPSQHLCTLEPVRIY